MLVNISASNFKSFDKTERLSMISSSKIQTHTDHVRKIKDTKILKNAVIYGANASGKSNLVEILRFMQWTLQHGLPFESRLFFSRTKAENEHTDSEFELQFTLNGKFYAYGFSVLLSEGRITGEWLYELRPHGSAKLLFEVENAMPTLGSLKLTKDAVNRFTIYAEDFAQQDQNRLFLGVMNHGKDINKLKGLEFLFEIYDWLCNHIVIITPNTILNSFSYYYQEGSLEKISELLADFDTGISNVAIKKITQEELKQSLPIEVYNNLIEKIKLSTTEFKGGKLTMRSHDTFFAIDFQDIEHPNITTLCLHHGESPFDFSFKEESDGTQRIFDLLDLILSNKDHMVYIIDELERSLHPNLTKHFLELFMETHKNSDTQLLFTTHESSIMDLKLFRRDEIWFIERDHENCSHIYSLAKFKERYDTKLSKAYLEGRYGAIPVLSSIVSIKGE